MLVDTEAPRWRYCLRKAQVALTAVHNFCSHFSLTLILLSFSSPHLVNSHQQTGIQAREREEVLQDCTYSAPMQVVEDVDERHHLEIRVRGKLTEGKGEMLWCCESAVGAAAFKKVAVLFLVPSRCPSGSSSRIRLRLLHSVACSVLSRQHGVQQEGKYWLTCSLVVYLRIIRVLVVCCACISEWKRGAFFPAVVLANHGLLSLSND